MRNLALAADRLSGALAPPRGSASPVFVLAVGALLFVWFWVGAVLVAETNQNRLTNDQQYNIELAKEAEGDWYPHRVKGIVEPLWPWLASKFNAEADDAATFVRGKLVNLLLGGVFLAGAAFWLRRRWGALAALVFVVVGGLGVMIERCVYFQPEPLYYLLSLGAFAHMLTLLRRNPLWLFAVCGLLCGLSYLAKSAIVPMMVGFAGVSGALVAGAWLSRRWKVFALAPGWHAGRQVVGLAVLAACFAVVILPRAVFSQKQFGDPLHSWPSYWMWQDDFGSESVPFMAAHPDRAALEALTDDERPSLGNYLARHSGAEVVQRLRSGMAARLHEFFFHEGKRVERGRGKPWKSALRYRGCYLAGVLATLVVLAVAASRHGLLSPGVAWPAVAAAVFVVGSFLTYWAAFGWYYAIGRGPRFMLALYLPMLYAALAACVRTAGMLPERHPARAVATAALTALLVLAAGRALELVVHPHFAG